MHYLNIDKDTARYPNADKDTSGSPGKGDSKVEVLELEANEDDIKWSFSQGTA